MLTSVAGFAVGRVARFSSGANDLYRRLTVVDATTRTIQWTDPLVPAFTAAATAVTTAEFRLLIRYRPTATAELTVVEDWRDLSMESTAEDYVAAVLNHPFTGSRYITVTDISGAAAAGVEIPAVAVGVSLGSSAEPAPAAADFIGDPATGTGLSSLDTVQMQLLAVPDVHSLNAAGRAQVVDRALAYCANRGD